jgi:hypothetical protein
MFPEWRGQDFTATVTSLLLTVAHTTSNLPVITAVLWRSNRFSAFHQNTGSRENNYVSKECLSITVVVKEYKKWKRNCSEIFRLEGEGKKLV